MLDPKPFSFVANCKNLEATIKKITSVLSITSNPSYFLQALKKKVYVIGMSGDTFSKIALTGVSSDADGAFEFSASDLCGLIKNRNDLEFSFTGQGCSFKQVKGSYKGSINITPSTGDQQTLYDSFTTAKSKEDTVLPADVISLLKIGLSSVNIKDVYQNTTLISFVTLDPKGNLRVSSFDSQHFGLFKMATGFKGIQFNAAIPASYFSMIDSIASGVEAKFSVSSGKLHVVGRGFNLVLPATQAEETHYTMVEAFMEGITHKTFTCVFDLTRLMNITDNLFTLYNANTSFILSSQKGTSLTVDFTTPSGAASDSMKVKPGAKSTAFKASVDPRLFKDILFLSRNVESPTLEVSDKVLAIKGTTPEKATLFLAAARSE